MKSFGKLLSVHPKRVWVNGLWLYQSGSDRWWYDPKTGLYYPFIGGATHATFTPVADAFRFYEDGTESGSSPIDAQDTNISRLVDSNSKVHLRYRVQETGGADGATTDDYGLEYSLGGGAFTAVTASSTHVQADTGSSLTDGGTTTNRATNGISDGTGSFVAGEQEEGNGVIEDRQLTLSNFTEHVWAILLIASALANGNTLDFRVTLNGGTPGMTNSVTPRITVTKTPPPEIGMAWSRQLFVHP